MRTQRALLSTTWLILGLLLTAGETPSERIVSKYSSTARAKSISFQETGEEGDPGFHGLFPGFGGYQLEFLGGDERSWINIKFGKQTVDLYSGRRWMRVTELFRTRRMTWWNGAGWRKTAASRPTQLFTESKLATTKHGNAHSSCCDQAGSRTVGGDWTCGRCQRRRRGETNRGSRASALTHQ